MQAMMIFPKGILMVSCENWCIALNAESMASGQIIAQSGNAIQVQMDIVTGGILND